MFQEGFTLEDRIMAIENLPIVLPDKGSAPSADSDADKNHADDDVNNSILLAQLTATAQANRNTEVDKWYKIYTDTLETLGWIVQGFRRVSIINLSHHPLYYTDADGPDAPSFSQLKSTGTFGSIDGIVVDLAKTYLSGQELTFFKKVVDALRNKSNGGSYEIFNKDSKDVKKANFQIGMVSNIQGNALVKIGAHYYTANKGINTVLFFTFGTESIDFSAGHQSMVLNESVYSKLRDAVVKKLGKIAVDRINNIIL